MISRLSPDALARVLREHGLRLGLEYVGTATSLTSRKYPFIHTLAETRELIEAVDAVLTRRMEVAA